MAISALHKYLILTIFIAHFFSNIVICMPANVLVAPFLTLKLPFFNIMFIQIVMNFQGPVHVSLNEANQTMTLEATVTSNPSKCLLQYFSHTEGFYPTKNFINLLTDDEHHYHMEYTG